MKLPVLHYITMSYTWECRDFKSLGYGLGFSIRGMVMNFFFTTSPYGFWDPSRFLFDAHRRGEATSVKLTAHLSLGFRFKRSGTALLLLLYDITVWAAKILVSRDMFNSINAEINPICHLLTLLGSHHILHVGKIRVKIHHFLLLFLTWGSNLEMYVDTEV